ncbi:RbsD/FucU family protein [Kosmotoga sp. DU53]|uniref:RbsD/FucU family protein n=1 Tax=Kosmotoga sp. DU53 TaxID=1310160 RepID=UPI0007C55B92|nr:RbsD/FucU domain-containing protein [Kosmotoga sp. DU53]MDK2953926.1 L-fucose mutarotase [Kosmotoga sp.]OAA23041.1 fucose isomerase [Kosmotoga sp. DU53]
MLKNIPRVISPDLMTVLMKMGHGDEIVLVDANFPAESLGPQVVRADGLGIPELLEAILTFLPLDTFADINVVFMDNGKEEKPPIWKEFTKVLEASGEKVKLKAVDRFEFYDLARKAYCIVATGETALYANIILKKGVVIF